MSVTASTAAVGTFLATFGPELLKGIFSGAGSKIGEKLLDQAIEIFKTNHKKEVPDSTYDGLRNLMVDEPGWWNAFKAQFKMFALSKVIILGPSGSGKTSLRDYLDDPKSPPPQESTSQKNSESVLAWSQYIYLTDTPGSWAHVDSRKQIYEPFGDGHTILIIVLGAGFEKTIGIEDLRRPGWTKERAVSTLADYHRHCLEEENEYLKMLLEKTETIKDKFSYIMVVVNKMDLWKESYDNVLAYYDSDKKMSADFALPGHPEISFTVQRSEETKKLLKEMTTKYGKEKIGYSVHPCSLMTSAFREVASKCSHEEALLSRMLLRAQIRARIIED